jgi:hypothetical protein
MATLPDATAVPPVDALVSEVVASLALAAHAYLEPGNGNVADIASAEIAIDVAAVAFDRISGKLKPEERSAIAVLLTDVRMTCVRKRG